MEVQKAKTIIDYVPAIVAFIATLFGSFIGGYFALLQIRRNSITSARLKKLDDLKERISDVNKTVSMVYLFLHASSGLDDDDEFKLEHTKKYIFSSQEKSIELTKALALLSLNLDKSEFLSNALLEKFSETLLNFNSPNDLVKLKKVTEKSVEGCLAISTRILKLEWEKAKSGKINYKRNKKIEKYRLESIEKESCRFSEKQLSTIKYWTDYYSTSDL